MSAWGAIVMSFFGSLFAAVTMYLQCNVSGAVLALPFMGCFVLWLAAGYVVRLPGEGIVLSEKARRAMMWSSIGEGIGLFLVSVLLVNVGRLDLRLPAMALIVGLHFLPIAFAVSFRPIYVLGAALILSAIVGFCTRAPLGGEIAGLVAAISLWVASLLALYRDWNAKRSSDLVAG